MCPDNDNSAESSEEVVLRRADDRGGGRLGGRPAEAAHQRDRRRLGGLALDQRSGGSNLVGEAGLGDFEFAAEQVGLAAPVDHRRQSGGTERDTNRAAPP